MSPPEPPGPTEPYAFLKGHGTRNDFVLLPDHDGLVHGELDPARVQALCDRRSGIGGDGVIRVLRASPGSGAGWFMDYRNADGSMAEMCGNGIRVLARHLVQEGLVDATEPIPILTADGMKNVVVDGPEEDATVTVDMGAPRLLGETRVAVGERVWPAVHVDMGNPHAVAFVDDLAHPGPLTSAPLHDADRYPDGVNVEFVVRRGERHVAMRVHERGSGETMSCGTGACAVMVAAAAADGAEHGGSDGGEPVRDVDYRVDLPGGTLVIRWTSEDRVLMSGPAVIVATGTTSL